MLFYIQNRSSILKLQLLILSAIIFSGCSECKTSSDCSGIEICSNGSCKETSTIINSSTTGNNNPSPPAGTINDSDTDDSDSSSSYDTDDTDSGYDTSQFSSCLNSPYTISNEAELNDFFLVECILDNLVIETDYVTNLDLPNLKYAGGSITIRNNTSLIAVDGLSSLEYVKNNLILSNNNLLSDITGLKNLKYIGGSLLIDNNLYLNDFSGFQSITSINGSLVFRDIPSLTVIDGFDSLESIGADVEISGNDTLTALSGFKNLKTIDGGFSAYKNPYLYDCDICTFLENIDTVSGSLFIDNNCQDNCTSNMDSCVN
jgi:hypothetical protein